MSGHIEDKNKHIRSGYVSLNIFECIFNWCMWLPLCMYPFYAAYKLSTKYYDQISKQYFVEGWFNQQRDATDYEWEFWRKQILYYFLTLVPYTTVGLFIRKCFPVYYKSFQTFASLVLLSFIMSVPGMCFTCVHAFAFFCILYLKNSHLLWLWSVMMICFLNSKHMWKLERNIFFIDPEYKNAIHYGTLMSYLRLISIGCRVIKEKENVSLMDLLHYNYYLPLFFNGPVLTYDLFDISLKERKSVNIVELCKDIITCMLYSIGLDIFCCFIYTSALSYHYNLAEQFTSKEVIVFIWMHLQVFFVKYVIFYRFSGIFVKIDGLVPPEPPKCITSLYTFAHMWRYFDKGLHRFLQQCIYIPLGGCQKGLFHQFVAAALCFSFVANWHGGGTTMWLWAIFNYLGIAIESLVNYLIKKGYFNMILLNISCKMYRRLCAFCGAFSVFGLVCSNMIFLIGHNAAFIILQRLVMDWFATLIVLFTFYFTCQCSIDCM